MTTMSKITRMSKKAIIEAEMRKHHTLSVRDCAMFIDEAIDFIDAFCRQDLEESELAIVAQFVTCAVFADDDIFGKTIDGLMGKVAHLAFKRRTINQSALLSNQGCAVPQGPVIPLQVDKT